MILDKKTIEGHPKQRAVWVSLVKVYDPTLIRSNAYAGQSVAMLKTCCSHLYLISRTVKNNFEWQFSPFIWCRPLIGRSLLVTMSKNHMWFRTRHTTITPWFPIFSNIFFSIRRFLGWVCINVQRYIENRIHIKEYPIGLYGSCMAPENFKGPSRRLVRHPGLALLWHPGTVVWEPRNWSCPNQAKLGMEYQQCN